MNAIRLSETAKLWTAVAKRSAATPLSDYHAPVLRKSGVALSLATAVQNVLVGRARSLSLCVNVHWLLVAMALAMVTGCSRTRSISNSGYDDHGPSLPGAAVFGYRGEIDEMDVLGLEPGQAISEAQIQSALNRAHPVELRRGDVVLVVQSGAVFPDGPMIAELEKNFKVVPFSGSPAQDRSACFLPERRGGQYARMLRLAAAQAGAKAIVCYWGALESAEKDLPTKSISWIPVMNWTLPDRVQQVRLRLKMAVIDVQSGSWSMFSPEVRESDGMTTRKFRKANDQCRVEQLKQEAYASAARELTEAFAR